ncbi:hypothetical protein SAMN05216505_11430 [Streptomyces prasinopilosus]|uniref:Uncharacterized protein n=1 Tax=Streptomyces prasinopilosus TaxID=67344 RepID=A0A1G6Z0B2_9ACTN|nr:hypothetical protein SAMN05216505_11430 [Streptomyces prasinopilosus]
MRSPGVGGDGDPPRTVARWVPLVRCRRGHASGGLARTRSVDGRPAGLRPGAAAGRRPARDRARGAAVSLSPADTPGNRAARSRRTAAGGHRRRAGPLRVHGDDAGIDPALTGSVVRRVRRRKRIRKVRGSGGHEAEPDLGRGTARIVSHVPCRAARRGRCTGPAGMLQGRCRAARSDSPAGLLEPDGGAATARPRHPRRSYRSVPAKTRRARSGGQPRRLRQEPKTLRRLSSAPADVQPRCSDHRSSPDPQVADRSRAAVLMSAGQTSGPQGLLSKPWPRERILGTDRTAVPISSRFAPCTGEGSPGPFRPRRRPGKKAR